MEKNNKWDLIEILRVTAPVKIKKIRHFNEIGEKEKYLN